ncbi:MAG: cytochrome c3 family protein [Bifidobacteriaceae bacterium]|jgi:hypothetical protein|nr:cytochrome c3 family protein [Bifidobacteriaceae bacterium]
MGDEDIKQPLLDGSETEGQEAESEPQSGPSSKAKKQRGKGRIALITVGAGFVLVAGGGGVVYGTQHSNPSFCNAVCHTPMDPYVESYKQGTSTNPLQADLAGPLNVTVHKDAPDQVVCLDCHTEGIGEQLEMGTHWLTGDYTYPLEPITLVAGEVTKEGQLSGTTFCLREGCHVGVESTDDLKQVLADQPRNPHDSHNGLMECTLCHRTHEQSMMWCTQCHADAEVPEGWLTWTDQQSQLKEAEAGS